MYCALARAPATGSAARLAYWRKARESLVQGIGRLEKVGESVALTGPNKELLDEGRASRALAEAALASSAG